MAFDPYKLLARQPIVTRHTLTRDNTILYALGVGAGNVAADLDFVYEEQLKALPTMAVVMACPGFIWSKPEFGVDWKKLLHGEQHLQLFAALPVEGELRSEMEFISVHDKGADKGALVYSERRLFDDSGNHLATDTRSSFLRGDGGCGTPDTNKAAAPKPHAIPEAREPDITIDLPTSANQAMIYRLSGDRNPLHIDPEVARGGGFDQPVLHGLCTYGVVGRALLRGVAGNRPARLTQMNVRFSAPVFPGETLRTEIWRQQGSTFAFRARVLERDLMVITNGYVQLTGGPHG